MSITQLAIENNRVTWMMILIIVLAGFGAYKTMPQSEDPGYIIRTAMVMTVFPGASPERVEDLVTDPLEAVIQQVPELDFVTSESKTGVSFIYVNIKESYKEMRPIWDKLRRKIDSAAADLPAGVIGPTVNDEFGDVFGIIFTIAGEGYTYAELKETADDVRDEMLRIPDVAKVDIYGQQEERIFIEYDNGKLAQLGISPSILQQLLQGQNILFPGGKISNGIERMVLEPSGNFLSVEEVRRSVITLPGRTEVIYLEDIASVTRGYIDPPKDKLHTTGTPALAIGISMREGGNIITMGEKVKQAVNRLQEMYPIGLEFDFLVFQPEEVSESVNNFLRSLYQAIAIVMVVMLLFLGLRTGLVVTTLIPMAMLLSFVIMNMCNITLNTVSLAALIIALGMLVDNAIVMSESIMSQMARGKRAAKAAIDSATELRVPLLTSSLTTSAAFLTVYLAESSTGEYTSDLFRVVTITLLASWVLSLTMVPMLCVLFIKVKQQSEDHFDSGFNLQYRNGLVGTLKRPWLFLLMVALIFVGAMQLSRFIPAIFFPETERAFLTAELNFPVGTPIERTEAMVKDLEHYFTDSLKVEEERPAGLINWASFIGVGAPRFFLAISPIPRKEELAYLIINTTSREVADKLRPQMEDYLWRNYPDLDAVIKPLNYGPPVIAPIEVRVSGREEAVLFEIVEKIKTRLRGIAGSRNITDNWGARVKKLNVVIDQTRARRAGVSSFDIALSLQTILSGIEVTEFRENENIIPVVMRAAAANRGDIAKLETIDVFSQASGQTVPLKQVADIKVVWEPSTIYRRDRAKSATVSAYTMPGVTALEILDEFMPWLETESKTWPVGFVYEYGGELESSADSQESIMAKLPIAFAIILILLVSQFNSFRRPFIILMTVPLAMIGVNIGLVLLNGDMGFMTFLGVISLIGIVINNAIVLLDRIRIEIEENGLSGARAVIVASQMRLRPILLTTVTTIGGLIPLWLGGGPMWRSMAIAIMFGLMFSTVLTLGVVPVLYSILFRIKYKNFEY